MSSFYENTYKGAKTAIIAQYLPERHLRGHFSAFGIGLGIGPGIGHRRPTSGFARMGCRTAPSAPAVPPNTAAADSWASAAGRIAAVEARLAVEQLVVAQLVVDPTYS